jgi:hypothetical protein
MSAPAFSGRLFRGATIIVLLTVTILAATLPVGGRASRWIATLIVGHEIAVTGLRAVMRESAVTAPRPAVHASAVIESPTKPNLRQASSFDSAPPVPPKLADYRPVILSEHPSVRKYLKYFSTDARGRRTFEAWLERARSYAGMIHEQLDKEGLPRDLLAVALIESGLDPFAVSPVGATGMWQFIEETGRLYGLSRTEEVDQRRAPLLATQAAARYLRDLYDQFHDWPLALASYNAGPGRVRQLMDETLCRDFWSLAERSLALPEETQRYVPKIIAAMTVLRSPRAFGFDEFTESPPPALRSLTVLPATPLELLAKALALSVDDLREINPDILVNHVPTTYGNNVVRIPASRATLSELALGDGGSDLELLRSLARVEPPEFSFERARCFPLSCRGNRDASGWKQVSDALDTASRRTYRVKPGDSLEKVAIGLGISAKKLMRVNRVRHPLALRVGQILRIPSDETM